LVEETPLAELQALNAGQPRWSDEARVRLEGLGISPPDFGDRYADERVPTLEQVLSIGDARLMIELKKTARVDRLAERVVEAVRRARAEDRVAVASFDATLLDAVNRREPSLPLIGVLDDPAALEVMLQRRVVAVAVHEALADFVLERSPPGLAIWTWTVVTVERAAALAEAGVHGLITDIPSAVLQALRGSRQ
jgi:glycerophosphoryl diester phosphodiesterase